MSRRTSGQPAPTWSHEPLRGHIMRVQGSGRATLTGSCHETPHVGCCHLLWLLKRIRSLFGFILAQTKALRPWGRVKPISPESKKTKKFNLLAGKYFYRSSDRPKEPKRTSSVSSIRWTETQRDLRPCWAMDLLKKRFYLVAYAIRRTFGQAAN